MLVKTLVKLCRATLVINQGRSYSPADELTIQNLGFRWKIEPSVTLQFHCIVQNASNLHSPGIADPVKDDMS